MAEEYNNGSLTSNGSEEAVEAQGAEGAGVREAAEEGDKLGKMGEDELRDLGNDMLTYVSKVLNLTIPHKIPDDELTIKPNFLDSLYESEWLDLVSSIVEKSSEPQARITSFGIYSLRHSTVPVRQYEALRLGGINEILSTLANWREAQTVLAELTLANSDLQKTLTVLDNLECRVCHYDAYVLDADTDCANPHAENDLRGWIKMSRSEINICLSEAEGCIARLDNASGEIVEGCRVMMHRWFTPYIGYDLEMAAFYQFLKEGEVPDNFTQDLKELIDLRSSLIDRIDAEERDQFSSSVCGLVDSDIDILCNGKFESLLKSCRDQAMNCRNDRAFIGYIANMFCNALDVLNDSAGSRPPQE